MKLFRNYTNNRLCLSQTECIELMENLLRAMDEAKDHAISWPVEMINQRGEILFRLMVEPE